MELRIIFYNTFSERDLFEVTKGIHKWDIFLVIQKGSFAMSFDGTHQTVIEENEIAYFPAHTAFERRVIEPISFYQFAFLCDPDHPFFKSLSAGKLSIPKPQVSAMINGMERISHISDNKELLLHMIERICAEQYIYGRSGGENTRLYSEDILTALRYMNDHLSEKIDIDRLAAHVYLSHTGFIKKFTKQIGIPPSKYIIMIRMRYAKQLLLEGTLPINEIAAKCGYSNAYYFTNAFHRAYDTSPTEFRKRYLLPDN